MRRRPGRPLRAALLTLGLLAAGGAAEARTVRIVQADTLELRRVDDQELVVIGGESVELRVDEDVVRARRVEFNRTRRTLTLVGAASYRSARDGQVLTGENLVIELGDESVSGEDVIVSDDELQIRGQEVERVPGQLRATGGYFTTCARCGRTPNDYAFRAQRLVVYPGDRLVAYRAQLLLADAPVLFFPVIVLPLNDPERQPRFVLGQDAQDGLTIEADLPFSVGASTLGTTLLRYYQNRNPSVGYGVNLRSYAPLPFVDRVTASALVNPRPGAGITGPPGDDLEFSVNVAGRVPLSLALRDLDYSLNVSRRDTGLAPDSPERGVTNVTFGAKVDYPLFTAELNYVDRYGPAPVTGLGTPLRTPEVVLDPKPYTQGNFSADFRFSAGRYTGASNPLSRSASAQGPNITTERLEETHTLAFTARPWTGADLSLNNTFSGRYYGTGARTVDLGLGAQLTQRWATDNTLTLSAGYRRTEGTSPFAFDADGRSPRRLSAPVGVALSTVPARGVRFGVSYTRDLFLAPEQQSPLGFTLDVTRTPLTLTSSLTYNLYTKELDTFSYSATLADPQAGVVTTVPAQPATAATPARPATTTRSSRWPAPRLSLTASGGYTRAAGPTPLTLGATVTGDVRSNAFSVSVTRDLNRPTPTEVSARLSASGTRDTVLNPFTFTLNERLNIPEARVSGDAALTWRGRYQLTSSHDLLLQPAPGRAESGTLTFGVGTVSGSANAWQLTYGGPYDLVRGDWTRPTLTGSLALTRPDGTLAASGTLNVAGLDQPRTELARADVSGAYSFGSRLAVSGRALYTSTRSGPYPNDVRTETLQLDPLRVSLGIGRAGQAPGAYVTGSLRQTFTWQDGVRQNPGPLTPVIGLTIDRCCWALQAEADLLQKRYRLAVGLPGQSAYPLFDLKESGFDAPLLRTQP